MATERKKAGRIAPVLMGDYDNTTTYRRLDWVYYGGTSYICKKNNTIGIIPSNTERWQKIVDKISDVNITFTENTEREIYTSGESLSTIIGKIQNWLISLNPVAFTGKYTDLSDTPMSLKNPKSLKFTGGVTEEYDGSSEKSINIPTVPSSLKNPNALNIKFNGTSQATYDGSAVKEVNVTPAAINAVNTSTVLTTKEQISANTNAANVTGALAAKAIMADIAQLSSNLPNKTDRIINGINYETSSVRSYQLDFDATYLVTCFPVSSDNVNHNLITIAIVQTGRMNGKNGQIIILYQTNGSDIEDKDSIFLTLGNDGILTINNSYRYMHYSITKL